MCLKPDHFVAQLLFRQFLPTYFAIHLPNGKILCNSLQWDEVRFTSLKKIDYMLIMLIFSLNILSKKSVQWRTHFIQTVQWPHVQEQSTDRPVSVLWILNEILYFSPFILTDFDFRCWFCTRRKSSNQFLMIPFHA